MHLNNITTRKDARIIVVEISNPPANALNYQTLVELDQVMTLVEDDDEIHVIVLTGKGNFFVAGADIKDFTTIKNTKQGKQLAEYGQRLLNKIEGLSKPVIAMINGACLGGGLELAMSCHIRIAAHSAKLGLPETNLGLIPGFAGTQRLARLTNREKALELILTGDMIDGAEAHRIGLVTKSVALEELESTVKELAERIAAKSLVSVQATLSAVDRGLSLGQELGSLWEAELFGKLFESEDAKEGINAFLEKRPPVFKNK